MNKFENVHNEALIKNGEAQSWGFIETRVGSATIENHLCFSADSNGGRNYAYKQVKLAKRKTLRAFHGIVNEEGQLVAVEAYNTETKKWVTQRVGQRYV
jgi:hypothetical protein